MKTTLKRGYGRGAAVNGNGHGGLPPGRLAVTRYRQPEPPRRGALALVGRILLGTLLLAIMVVAGLGGGAYLYYHQSVAAVTAHTPDVKKAEQQLETVPANHAAIALVVGYDHRMGADSVGEGPSRSDTLMLVRADPRTKTISLLSFPRDLLVPLYCANDAGDPVPQGQGKINSAYAICGARGSLATVKELTGLPVNFLITVDFHGFKEVVDTTHGVWMDVDRRYYNRNVGTAATNYANINLHPGYQRLNGGQALAFVRYRHTDSDLYRLARQQEFVKAFKQQASTSLSPLDLPKVVSAITHNVEIGSTAGGSLGGAILRYALFAYQLPNGHFFQDKIDGLGQDAYFNLIASPDAIQKALQEFENPNVAAPKEATAAALGKKLKTKAPLPKNTYVYVLNGNGVAGAAANAAYDLGQRGYTILTSAAAANAPTQDYYKTTVFYDRTVAGADAAAAKLSNLFAPALVKPLTAPIRRLAPKGTMDVVVVGQTFHGDIAPAPADTTPKHEPAAVRYDPYQTEAAVKEDQAKVSFRLLVPAVVERNSRLSSLEGARLYPILAHRRALRLTFVTGANEYWGVEESDWGSAPVLAHPSQTHHLKGRTYDFYYVGAHLHMVVLHGKGSARYWVVNTLLDTLSNETMIAIAKGLRPPAK